MDATAYEDAERLRKRQAEADDDATRPPGLSVRGAPCVVAKVTSAYGGSGLLFYSCQAQDLTGAEVDGGPGTLASAGYTFLAVNLGSVTPPAGTAVICTLVDYRWAFRYDG